MITQMMVNYGQIKRVEILLGTGHVYILIKQEKWWELIKAGASTECTCNKITCRITEFFDLKVKKTTASFHKNIKTF